MRERFEVQGLLPLEYLDLAKYQYLHGATASDLRNA